MINCLCFKNTVFLISIHCHSNCFLKGLHVVAIPIDHTHLMSVKKKFPNLSTLIFCGYVTRTNWLFVTVCLKMDVSLNTLSEQGCFTYFQKILQALR